MNKVEVKEINNIKGRGLFATQLIQAGEELFSEKPLVSCQFLWNAEYGYSACEFCLKPLESALENARRLTGNVQLELPFQECCLTNKQLHVSCPHCGHQYCSQECLEEAWNQYHKTLCTSFPPNGVMLAPLVAQLCEAWKHFHYPPETASIMLLVKMLASVRQAHDKQGAINLFGQFQHKTVNEHEHIAHKLLGDQFQSQLNTLRELVTQSLYDPDIHQWFEPDGFQSLIALIGTNGQGIGTSALSVWVSNCDNLKLDDQKKVSLDLLIEKLYDDINENVGMFLNNEGSGLYPLQSSCNHSCEPNAEATFPHGEHTLVMQAIKEIKSGEEIVVSYLDECARHRSRHSRVKLLRDNYLFTCDCEKCESQKDELDVTSSEEEDEEEEEGGEKVNEEEMNCEDA